jgi:hypothetical protein
MQNKDSRMRWTDYHDLVEHGRREIDMVDQ